MRSDQLKTFVKDNFCNRKLIIVSNREPYIHKKTLTGTKVDNPAGGLTSAMDDVMKAVGGTWIAWGSGSADKEVVDEKDRISVPPDNPSYTLKRVWLSKTLIDNYYHGYSNQVLWPLCHTALNRIFFRRRFWENYVKANFFFAESIVEEANDDSIIWIHDYHLCVVPKLLRERKPELTIAHFWHIPWPDWSIFRACPRSSQVLEGLLGNDLIGFQLNLFAHNFMECVKNSLDAEIDHENMTITYKDHVTRLKAFPISIDFGNFDRMSNSDKTLRAMNRLRSKYNLPSFVGVGVDRLEYTKGLLMRLQALYLFFEKYEKLRGHFSFIQIAVPTRMKEPYLSYKKTVEELVEKINNRFSRDHWTPIIYIDSKIDHKDLVAYYRLANVGIISSIYDGMNLVAKEFVASQVDEKGVLILSELAGAAEELDGAVLVNPYDTENFSDSINVALRLPGEEKSNRMKTLRRQIRDNDIYKWILDILYAVAAISSIKSKQCKYFFDNLEEVKSIIAEKNAFLFLDYDGTLTPIVESPEKAFMSDEMRNILLKLKEKYTTAVISGRAIDNIKKLVSIEDIIYAGNHGSEIWGGDQVFLSQDFSEVSAQLRDLMTILEDKLSHIPGVLIEDKGITASIHFRQVWAKDLGELFSIFWDTTKRFEDMFRITSGKKVFEIRPLNAWNKGHAVEWIMDRFGNDSIPVYLGDDTTDEDAFRVVRGKGLSIGVGDNLEADYYIKNQDEVQRLLNFFLEIAKNSPLSPV
jgi:trehalose 6-phosphate synthase/phosphatase